MKKAEATKYREEMSPWKTILHNIQQYGNHSSIHGIGYIFDQTSSIFNRFLWSILMIISLIIASLIIRSSYTQWQRNKVITSLKTVAKPVTELEFPAVTICAAGQHMDAVEQALYNNFMDWDSKRPLLQKKDLEERFGDYMREVFFIDEKGLTIMELLNTMIIPSEDADNNNAVRRNEVYCAKKKRRSKRNTLSKIHRMREGHYYANRD